MFLRNDISQEELEVLINMDKDIKKAEEESEEKKENKIEQKSEKLENFIQYVNDRYGYQ